MTSDKSRLIGERIRSRRLALGMSQSDLAQAARFEHHQQVSQIESGDRSVKALELADIARALFVDFNALLPSGTVPLETLVLWRAKAEAAPQTEANFVRRCEQYYALERLADDVQRAPLPRIDEHPAQMSWSRAAALADDVRDTLDLGSRPAASMLSVVEDRFHVKVLYEPLKRQGSAASSLGEFGAAMLIDAEEAPWRRNFSCAHELFHLVTWDCVKDSVEQLDERDWDATEKVAEAFAAALLLPADSLLAEFDRLIEDRRVRVSDLLTLAIGFGVSIDAMLWRLVNLNRLDRDAVTRLLSDREVRDQDRQLRRDEWWRPETLPTRYVRLAYQAHMRDRLSLSKLAEYLDTDIASVGEQLAKYGLDEPEDESREVLSVRC